MEEFTKEKVDQYAKSLLIGLTEEENELVRREFSIIKEKIERVAHIENIDQIKPMTHPFDLYLEKAREDIASPSQSLSDLLKNCKKINDREIEIPKVVGEESC